MLSYLLVLHSIIILTSFYSSSSNDRLCLSLGVSVSWRKILLTKFTKISLSLFCCFRVWLQISCSQCLIVFCQLAFLVSTCVAACWGKGDNWMIWGSPMILRCTTCFGSGCRICQTHWNGYLYQLLKKLKGRSGSCLMDFQRELRLWCSVLAAARYVPQPYATLVAPAFMHCILLYTARMERRK